jgi:L-alanine-DL-glutamate epimerase-like enolase superfamily enzyme
MKITLIETLRTDEFANVLWVRVHTDSNIIGLGETFHGASAVEAHIHDTLATRLLGRNPLLAENLLENGITAMKIWPFDPAAQESQGLFITAPQLKRAIAPFEKIRKVVGDKMDIMVSSTRSGTCRRRRRLQRRSSLIRHCGSKIQFG